MRMNWFAVVALCVLVVYCVGCGGETETTKKTTDASSDKSDKSSKKSTKSSSPKTASKSKNTPKSKATSPSSSQKSSASASASTKGGWGHLTGRFVYGGTAPDPAPLSITKDQEFCGKHKILDESLVVNKENGGLANVVVYLYVRRGGKTPTEHDSYKATTDAKVVMDNQKCRFEPHVCLVRTSQTLVLKNSDTVGHNTNITTLNNPPFNQTIASGTEIEHKISKAERRPAAVGCNIHPWMKGWVLSTESPYSVVSDKDGKFKISNLPAGKWTFQVWHERASTIGEVALAGKATKWSKGRFEVEIKGTEATDLGDIKLASKLFER